MRSPRRHLPRLAFVASVVAACAGLAGGGQARTEPSSAWAVATGPGSSEAPDAIRQDASIVRRLELVGELGGGATAVAVSGNSAFIGIGGRVVVLGISSPSRPVFVAETARLATEIVDLVVSDDILYALDSEGALVLVDVGDATAPERKGTLELFGTPLGLDAAGGLAAIALGDSGLAIIDVTDVTGPKLSATVPTRLSTRGVAIAGRHVFLAERDPWEAGLRVVDVSDVGAPKEVSFLYTPGGADMIEIREEHAFVLSSGGVMWVIDIADPAALARVGVYGDVAPAQPQLPESGPPARHLALTDDYALIARDTAGLDVIDVRFRGRPLRVATLDTPGSARAVAVHGVLRKHALVADWDHGLRIVDLADESDPVEVATYGTPGHIVALDAGEGYVAAADSAHGFRTIDITNPSRPALLGSVETKGTPTSVRMLVPAGPASYPYAVVGETPTYRIVRQGRTSRVVYEGGLAQVDLRHPAAPRLVAEVDDVYAESLESTLGMLYVAAGGLRVGMTPGQTTRFSGLQLFGLDPPRDPKLVSEVELPGPATGVALSASGESAFLTAQGDATSGSLHVIDVSRPHGPSPVGSLWTHTTHANGLAVVGDRAVVATSSDATGGGGGVNGVQIVDLSSPAAPQLVSGVELPGGATEVAVIGDGLVAAVDGQGGISLVDLAGPGGPALIDRFSYGGADIVTLTDGGQRRLYVGASPATFLVVDVVDHLVTPTPTPTATSTPTATATATATATHTPTPRPDAFVPLAVR